MEDVSAAPLVDRTIALVQPGGSKEAEAMGKVKLFCASLVKRLAPPLLREIVSVNGMRPGQDPFTPRRQTRSTLAAGPRCSKASAVEATLLRTLGITDDDLVVSLEVLEKLRATFDSPLQEPPLRAIAALFGKVIPSNLAATMDLECSVGV